MASTFRSAIRCSSGAKTSLTGQIFAASKRSLSSGSICRPASRPQNHVHLTKRCSSIPARQLATAAQPQSANAVDEPILDIPAFQFKDILPGGQLPPTKTLKVNIDGRPYNFDTVFLRDSCTCPTCVDVSTQQKLFTTSDIPVDIHPRRARIADGKLKIEWSHSLDKCAIEEKLTNGYHWSLYDVDFLKNSSDPIKSIKTNMTDFRRVFWDKRTMQRDVFWIDYDDYMNNELALAKALKHLSLYGLIFIKNVPDGRQVDRVPKLAKRIGNLKNTFYGETWSVKSVPNSKNIAYTSLDLGLHMDLLYFESPPGLQFLHCVENSVIGGSSYFVDAMRAAFILRQSAPKVFDVLTKFPVNFHYRNNSEHYRFSRPIVVMKGDNETYHPDGGIDHLNWAPPFQAPFTMDHNGEMVSKSTIWRSFLRGMGELNKQFEDPQNQYELQLKEGECVVFFNRRILHARRGFDAASGKRRLTGGYVDIDAFESACRVMAERHPDEKKGGGYEYVTDSGKFGYNQFT
ncbi:hypothetical protein H072_5221 [Dactylellina haptotyla CBS 200.50]|uniref:TauD/TfdA-like domain-containing protein n=1 Tax=Dactylellina haptotyla (strain CBS 200.50) TaxID=1284197 RepID=S8AD18_DACHA|nr:hypothetical protein H072_5221 [Dactylellina haptotyla CBS 200.50]